MQILSLLAISVAPIFILLFYIYYRDKYEKEPIKVLIKTFVGGALVTIPIIYVEGFLSNTWEHNFAHKFPHLPNAAYDAFIVAAFTEELFKLLIFFLLIWRNKNFNEKYDGIIYAVFVSLGFATVENLLYVFQMGIGTGFLRAFTAVPAHTLFGVSMGYYLGHAKMENFSKMKNIFMAFFIPFLLHGIYDFLLMAERPILLIVFLILMVVMVIVGLKKIKKHSDNSIFKQGEILNETNKNFTNTDNINT